MSQSKARKERREAERANKREMIKVQRKMKENKDKENKIMSLDDAIKERAVKVKKDEGVDKMYFCISASNIKDSLIINYVGSECLIERVGLRTTLTLDNGVVRQDNVIIYAEVDSKDRVHINYGINGTQKGA